MKFIIKHEIKGRIRISLARKFHTVREADVLEQYLLGLDGVTAAKVYERTADAVIYYKEDREAVLVQVAAFDGQITEKQEMAVKSSGRALNQEYKEKLIQKVLTRFATKTFLPAPVRAVYTSVQAIRYIVKGIQAQAACGGAGCDGDQCFPSAPRFQYGWLRYVPARRR